jgi:biotin carboxylase
VREGRREAEAAFGNGEGYLEKMILRARHVEVQILGDKHGNIYHLWERDCSVQRRNQKVVERAPAPYLTEAQRAEICELGLRSRAGGLRMRGHGRVPDGYGHGKFYFIEVNPRVQVEHTVTEEVTGIDIVRAQILIAEGKTLAEATGVAGRRTCKLERPRAPVPDHHRGPAEQLHPRLWPHHRLSRGHRHGHPAGRRHRLFGRRHHALLRFAAGKGHRLGADARKAIAGWTGPCANSASAAWPPTSPSSRTC